LNGRAVTDPAGGLTRRRAVPVTVTVTVTVTVPVTDRDSHESQCAGAERARTPPGGLGVEQPGRDSDFKFKSPSRMPGLGLGCQCVESPRPGQAPAARTAAADAGPAAPSGCAQCCSRGSSRPGPLAAQACGKRAASLSATPPLTARLSGSIICIYCEIQVHVRWRSTLLGFFQV
jgi:hypothetical protein